ncbi:alpha/beta hydrolase [Saccharopolyspora sp. CA-218241]|uniref:alpha/beta hydrolase n=1 Tax=Saccharopolyspora sp. CA-218241 TaxID=3240027 RepID=UPI003D96B512
MRKATLTTAVAVAVGALVGSAAPVLAAPADAPFEVPERYAKQRIEWAPCLPDPLPPGLPPGSERLECGTFTAPMDWHDPESGEDVTIAVSRLAAPGGDGRALFTNPGGPGGAGLSMPLALLQMGRTDLLANFDVYGIDVRGTGASSTVSCGPQEYSPLDLKDRSPDNIRAVLGMVEGLARDCQEHSGELGRHVTTEQTVADLDLLRLVEQREQVSWYGISGGTWLGAYYATYFPDSVERAVLDSNTQFTGSWQQVFGWQPLAIERRWREDLRPWLAEGDHAYGLGATPEAVQATVDRVRAELKANPIPTPNGPLDHNVVDNLLVQSLYSKSSFDTYGRTMAELAAGAPSEQAVSALVATRSRQLPMQADPADSMSATFYSIRCNDTAYRGGPGWAVANSEIQGRMFPTYGYHTISQPCAYWDRPDVQLKRPSGEGVVPVLMLQSENDMATATEGAKIAHHQFEGSRMVLVRDEGDHGVYGIGNTCVDDAVERYLIDGVVPEQDLTCQGTGLPEPGAISAFGEGRASIWENLEHFSDVMR